MNVIERQYLWYVKRILDELELHYEYNSNIFHIMMVDESMKWPYWINVRCKKNHIQMDASFKLSMEKYWEEVHEIILAGDLMKEVHVKLLEKDIILVEDVKCNFYSLHDDIRRIGIHISNLSDLMETLVFRILAK